METSCSTVLIFLIIGLCDLSTQQRVAPGVPPQHYDHGQQFQQQPPQHYQQGQVPMHQGQVPMHQGQVPMHQGQAPGQIPIQNMPHGQAHQHGQVQHGQVPHGQGLQPVQHHGQVPVQHGVPPPAHGQQPGHVPAQGGHHAPHGHHGGGHGQLLDASNVAQERQHIQEHMDVPIDTSQMSEQELQFHYFKMHDADNNNKLDGCELVKSLIHWHDQANHDPRAGVPIPEAKVFNDEELSNMIDPILANDDKNKDGFIDYGEFVQAQASAASRQAAQHAA